MLKRHADAFHIDEEGLHRFVTTREDSTGEIAAHIESCPVCQEDVAVLREMLETRSAVQEAGPPIPKELLRQIESLHGGRTSETLLKRLYVTAIEFLGAPFRLSPLALGTAAAVITLVVVSVPLWRIYKEVPGPDLGVAVQEPKASAPSEVSPTNLDKSNEDREQAARTQTQKRLERASPLSPPPAKMYSPEAKIDRPDTRGRTSTGLESGAAPQESPPPQVKKEKPYPSGVGIAPRTEQEGLARPRASMPPMAASPMKQGPAKPEYQGALKEGSAAAPAPPVSSTDSRIPVELRIVDSKGRDIKWLRFHVPATLASRYRFLEGPEREARADTGATVPEKTSTIGRMDGSEGAQLILIHINERNSLFDLSAKLLERRSDQEIRTMEATGVPGQNLQDQIALLVSSLLDKK
jgi:hypothetical protein